MSTGRVRTEKKIDSFRYRFCDQKITFAYVVQKNK